MREPVQTAPESEFSDPKRALMIQQVSEDAPSKAGIFRRVYGGRATPRQAIKAQCLQCCWMDEAAIRECKSTECPLWDFRPFQRRAETSH
jgi:hypothetical protein